MGANTDLRSEVKAILQDELKDLLEDAAWRIHQAWDHRQVPAEALNLHQHLLTGYTLANNTPVAGSISWTDLHIVYQGTDYGPFTGDTADMYVWFDHDHVTDKIQTSNTKPTISKDDAIIFVNEGGVAYEPMKSQLQHGALIVDGSVHEGEIASNAIVASKILDGAVGTGKLASGAVDDTKLADNAVTSTKINGGAVTNAKLGNGAVDDTKLASGAVTNVKIADGAVETAKLDDGAVSTTKLGDTAVTEAKLANNAVTGGKIADGAIVSNKLDDGAVTSGKIANGAVGDAQVGPGSIGSSKLNIFQHLLY